MALRCLQRAAQTSISSLAFSSQRCGPIGVRQFASSEEKDVIVIGGGPGGYVAAIKAAQLGLKVACVEGRGALGGTCLNIGCIPSKALLEYSHKFYDARTHFKDHGINCDNLSVDLGKMMEQKAKAVKGLTGGVEGLFKKNKVEYVKGWGTIVGEHEVRVAPADGGEEDTLKAKNIMIATGSVPSSVPGLTIDEEKIVSSTGALELKEIPKDLIVVGGGVIGLEMGSVWSRLGSNVTVIEFTDTVVPSLDADIRKQFQRTLSKQGLTFKLGQKVTGTEETSDGRVKLSYESVKDGKADSLEADIVLVATGRKPYTESLGLQNVGIELDRGKVPVDASFKTKVPSIWAIGDVIEGPMLAHKAEEDGVAAAENMAGRAGHVNYNTVPNIIYTHPEVAHVGVTEQQAKDAGHEVAVGKFSFMANSRARAVDNTDGLVKIVADKKSDKILGAHILGPNAGELIAELVLGMEYGASSEDIARACHGHPTMSEAVKEACMATYDKPVHM